MKKTHSLQYTVEDSPPIHITILLGFQQFLTMMGGSIAMPLIVAEACCVGPDMVGRAQIMGTLMFVNGLATLMQVYLGVRLPIIQGASFAFVVPMMAMQHLDGHQCPTPEDYATWKIFPGSSQHRNLWMSRLVEIQGAILMAGVLEAVIGSLGLVSYFFRYVGPLTIAPTTALIGLSLVNDVISQYAAKFWPVSVLAMGIVLICILYLPRVAVPFPSISLVDLIRKQEFKCVITWHRIFSLFPVLFAITISWGFYAILQVCDALPHGEIVDVNVTGLPDVFMSEMNVAPWFHVPYPGQWGLPQVHLALTIGMFAAVISSIIESIGDYCACARMCGVSLPPAHAMNRGITVEGLGCVVAGAFGSGPGVTSYSENVGAIGITGVASRRVIFVTSIVLLVLGCFTKLATFFVMIPEPVIGGILIAILSMVIAVGFSNLQFVDLNSTRNLLIFGLSLFLGLGIPHWVKMNREFMKSGSDLFDEVVVILLSTGMFVGGMVGFILDNTVPKGPGEGKDSSSDILALTQNSNDKTYDLPFGIWIKRVSCFRYVPISPTFEPDLLWKLLRSPFQRFTRKSPSSNNVSSSGLGSSETAPTSAKTSVCPSGATVNEAFDHSSISRTASLASLTLSFSNFPIATTPGVVPLASQNEEKWTDL